MAKFWPFGEQPITRRTLFKGAVAVAASGVATKMLWDQYSARVAETSASAERSVAGFIDVREFKKSMSVEQLNQTAEQYFASARNWDYFLAKPLADSEDAPALLNNVSNLLRGLQLVPGMTVVDFGAGSCWLSRWLTQMGMEVVALDVSRTALKIGQALYQRLPIIGARPAPRFLAFDGHRIELPDASVDRILCLDTFHHLLNPDEVLGEMGRILKPGGIAGFSEPGPRHSHSPQAQFEMRNFKVLEDDVDIRRIWSSARAAGFARITLGAFTPRPALLTLAQFEDFLEGGSAGGRFAETARAELQDVRLFFLQKGPQAEALDSRSRAGLAATLEVKIVSTTVKEGAPLTARVVVTNSGRALWLPRRAPRGAVLLGCHLLDDSGRLLDLDFFRHPLTAGEGRTIAPGETVTLDVEIPSPSKGSYVLEFDLVSESVLWFAMGGTKAVRVRIQIT